MLVIPYRWRWWNTEDSLNFWRRRADFCWTLVSNHWRESQKMCIRTQRVCPRDWPLKPCWRNLPQTCGRMIWTGWWTLAISSVQSLKWFCILALKLKLHIICQSWIIVTRVTLFFDTENTSCASAWRGGEHWHGFHGLRGSWKGLSDRRREKTDHCVYAESRSSCVAFRLHSGSSTEVPYWTSQTLRRISENASTHSTGKSKYVKYKKKSYTFALIHCGKPF